MLFPLIFNIAYRMVQDRVLAEDIAQEVFTIGFRKYANFEDQTLNEYRNYLWEVCKNRCIRVLGKARKPVPADVPVPAEPHSASFSLGLRQLCHSVLEEQEYLILALYYVEGYNYEEIGETLGKSTTWVFNTVRSIKGKLREALEKEDLHEAWADDTATGSNPMRLS
jgi:RNA polymerase sigma factor (sigma-70 family)